MNNVSGSGNGSYPRHGRSSRETIPVLSWLFRAAALDSVAGTSCSWCCSLHLVHFFSSRGQFSVSVAYLDVFKCQRPPLVHVLNTAEWLILVYLERSLTSEDIRRRAIPDVHRSFEGFSPQCLRKVRSS